MARRSRSLLRRGLRLVGWAAGCALALLAIGVAVVLAPVVRDPSPGFLARRGEIASARTTATVPLEGCEVREVTLRSTTGLTVDLAVRVPSHNRAPAPLVVLLAGYNTGRDAVRYVADTRGVVVAALSYPVRLSDEAGVARRVLEIRKAQRGVLDTVPAVLLATEWLARQPYVDPDRIELAGGSLGAFFAPIAGALEPRFRRVWLVHGAGDPSAVIAHGFREHIASATLRRLVGRFLSAAGAGRHLAPERWVGRISPRPVVVLTAEDDEAFPPGAVDALLGALGPPNEIVRLPGGHVRPSRTEIIRRITAIVFGRIVGDDEKPRESAPDPRSEVVTPGRSG